MWLWTLCHRKLIFLYATTVVADLFWILSSSLHISRSNRNTTLKRFIIRVVVVLWRLKRVYLRSSFIRSRLWSLVRPHPKVRTLQVYRGQLYYRPVFTSTCKSFSLVFHLFSIRNSTLLREKFCNTQTDSVESKIESSKGGNLRYSNNKEKI